MHKGKPTKMAFMFGALSHLGETALRKVADQVLKALDDGKTVAEGKEHAAELVKDALAHAAG